MRSHVERALVQEALVRAWGHHRPAVGLLPPADRGSPYARHAYRDVLSAHGMVCRMRDKGACLDKAVAERFFGSVKRAWPSHCAHATRQEAQAESIADIEMFSNSQRKHAYRGDVSPNDYEKWALVASLCILFPLTTTYPHGCPGDSIGGTGDRGASPRRDPTVASVGGHLARAGKRGRPRHGRTMSRETGAMSRSPIGRRCARWGSPLCLPNAGQTMAVARVYRWVVERPLAWLPRWRRLRVRYERRADIHEAFLTLRCALIC